MAGLAMELDSEEMKPAMAGQTGAREVYEKPQVESVDVKDSVMGLGGSAADSPGAPAGSQT